MKANSVNGIVWISIVIIYGIIFAFVIRKKMWANAIESDIKKGLFVLFAIVVPISIMLTTGGLMLKDYSEQKALKEKQIYYKELLRENEDNTKIEVEYGDKAILWRPTDVRPLNLSLLEFKAEEVGKHKVIIPMIDKDLYRFNVEYEITVVDTQNPIIYGVRDVVLNYGETLNVKRLGIAAEDKVDGPLKVHYSGVDKVKGPGVYHITVTAYDFNDNETTESFKVTVKEKVVIESPKEPPKKPESKPEKEEIIEEKPVEREKRQVITINNKEINYYNKGVQHGDQQIDANPWTVTTWDLSGFTLIHQNKDGMPTYFKGKQSDAFDDLVHLEVDETFTIEDHTGDIEVYKVVDIYEIELDNDKEMAKIYSFKGEGVILECNDDTNISIIIEARPL